MIRLKREGGVLRWQDLHTSITVWEGEGGRKNMGGVTNEKQ